LSALRLEDIAEKAGVARSTVSRVVNGHSNVSEYARERVMAVIEATGYIPNAAARTLASQRSNTIGLVLPHSVSVFFTDPYYPHLIKGVAQACNQYDYTLALYLAGSKADQDKLFPRVSRKGLFDGIIVQSGHHADQSLLHDLMGTNLPVIVAGRPLYEKQISYIDIDNVAAAEKAVRHLISHNRKRIATITGPLESAVGLDRLEGYRQALRSAGMDVDELLIVESNFTEAGGYTSMQTLLPYRPDAVFAASDVMAIGAMQAVRDAGMSVPQDIAFIGFDDLPLPAVIELHLTTIRQPVVRFGAQAVKILTDMIKSNSHEIHQEIMETELVIRGSCGCKPLTNGEEMKK